MFKLILPLKMRFKELYCLLQASSGAEPQVAVLCEAGGTYHPQYMSAAGRWTPDLTTKPHNCLKDKMEILDYCKKVSKLFSNIQNDKGLLKCIK